MLLGDWNAKVGSQEISGITGKFGLGIQNEEGQRLTDCQENALVLVNTLLPTTQEMTTHGYHQMVNTKNQIDYILCSRR